MKKIFLLLVLCLVAVAFFVNYTFHRVFEDGDHNLSIHVKETDSRYELRAEFPRNRTAMVQRMMDERLHTDHVFSGSRVDAQITANDITMRVRSRPGYLLLRMNKNENDSAAYAHIKDLERELKSSLGSEREN